MRSVGRDMTYGSTLGILKMLFILVLYINIYKCLVKSSLKVLSLNNANHT